MPDTTIYWVHFFVPPIEGDHRTDFFFTSMAAIYTMFTPRQIGCGVSRLWAIDLSKNAYTSRYCIIRREPVIRKQQGQNVKADGDDEGFDGENEQRPVDLNHPDIIK